ncbi:hypothetical protein QQF64_019355 [Cirrhinus molitorella]|uniref:Uncharacterized protein n=1 Tax=Cirrhinus molitorella TaxID=172907 RepID=A0ABR3LIL9_9TELE
MIRENFNQIKPSRAPLNGTPSPRTGYFHGVVCAALFLPPSRSLSLSLFLSSLISWQRCRKQPFTGSWNFISSLGLYYSSTQPIPRSPPSSFSLSRSISPSVYYGALITRAQVTEHCAAHNRAGLHSTSTHTQTEARAHKLTRTHSKSHTPWILLSEGQGK